MSVTSDLLEKLKVNVGGEPHTIKQLSSNNFIVGEDAVSFEAPGVGDFSIKHVYSGHVVTELPLKPLRGRPGFQATLLRGRNIFRLQPEDLEFSLFYKGALRDWTESIIKAFVILLVIQTFVVQTFFIPTGSMKNTLFPGDYIMVEKLTYRLFSPDPGEIVVFEFPDDPSKDFIKRLIAVGGDKLEIHGGVVNRNGRKRPEAYTVFKKRLYDPTIQRNPPEIGYDLRPVSQWPRQQGCQKSYVVALTPRLACIPDLMVDSVEQLETQLKQVLTVAAVEEQAGSYFFDKQKLELTIHPRGDVSLRA
jgi:signal peptidase I